MKSIFVTGTGTGVGKTIVGGALCAYLSIKKGLDVGVMKPVETGWDFSSSDALILKELSGSSDVLEDIAPYRFSLPCAPEVAAKKEGVEIDLDVLTGIFRKLFFSHDVLVIEGAGGVLVPIKEGFFFSDLAKAWNVPVIIVSENKLGTINHTLLTCHYLISKGIEIIGVILNDKEKERDISSNSNAEILKKYLPAPFLGVFPHISISPGSYAYREHLADLFEKNICGLSF